MIELHHVTAGYGRQTVLQDLSLSLEPGCLTSIIGVNGCGKSTTLKAILGMIPLQGGDIILDGESIRRMSRNNIARKIAYLSQGRNTPDMTVEQIVLHGRFPHLSYPRRYTAGDRAIAQAAMEQMGIADLARQPLSTLSGGMRQNTYIAMALAQGTDYVLLDEPTTYLDIAHQLELMKTLRCLAEAGKGIVTVTHDIQMAFTFSDRIILLGGGTVLGNDVPDEICRQNILEETMGVSLCHTETGYAYRYL